MNGISRAKRLEVAQYYLLGYPYSEIVGKTGVSHGSVTNIVKEIENGELTIPGTPVDQVNDLRQLSFDLKKKGLEPSQALLGISFFERLRDLGVSPVDLDRWSELVKTFAPADFPAKDFFNASLRLHELEETVGKSFENLTDEYISLKQECEKLGAETDSLDKRRGELTEEVESLVSQVNTLKGTKEELQSSLETQEIKSQELTTKVLEASKERDQLGKEVKELQIRKGKLSSEVDGKEESLRRLNEIGFSDADLLRLKNLFERMGERAGADANRVKSEFFSALSSFGDFLELQKIAQEQADIVKELGNKKSFLAGEIAELEMIKAVLQGEIRESASIASQEIRDTSGEAISLIRQEAEAVREQMKHILEDTLVAGVAIGEMRVLQRKGEESWKELEGFLNEVKRRLEVK